ncbi:MAG: hypothetical protein J3Q66DRAFT_345661 [Benniella sp.]|nr:MAG: hypothetical protein J3Q66DRAFT_345661 [Benniella sp.]
MASIMPFPNVATHRRMPHLPNTPRTPQEQQQTQPHPVDHTLQSQGQESTNPQLRLEDTLDGQPLQGRLVSPRGSLLIQDGDHELLSHGRPTSPLGLLSPSVSSPTINSHDSKVIKNALYDAFGCLYHPSAHTKHSISTTAAALRSGDVTPLMGLSPKASPLLRPNLGPSAPITPLELSDEASAAGYFGLHVPTPSSPALGVAALGPASGRNHGHHHHRLSYTHTSSHLSSAYTPDDQAEEEPAAHIPPISPSQGPLTGSTFDPVEHPVLSSLQALSLTHPHPPEHYRRHLGHSLGHDIVPIDEPPAIVAHNGLSSKANHASPSNNAAENQSRLLNTLPQGSLHPSVGLTRSNPFPMDHNENSSIAGFGHQGLV